LYSFELQRDRIISKRKLQHQNHIDSYVNPLTKALEYERMLKDENISKSQLAKKLGISRVRVTQILNLLKLPKKNQERILKNGKDEMITERKLRGLIRIPKCKQYSNFKKMLK
jgi:ParB/RepB/Spo0J family partition protein